MKDKTAQVLIQAPPQIANYLLNEKRRALVEIETRHEAPIIIVADEGLETPHFNVTRIREGDQPEDTSQAKLSARRATETRSPFTDQSTTQYSDGTGSNPGQAIADGPCPSDAGTRSSFAIRTQNKPKPGLFSRLKTALFGEDSNGKEATVEQSPARRNDNRRDRTDNRPGNARPNNQQNKNRPKNQNRQDRPERTDEEKKQFEEQRKLEQLKRQEEQQKRRDEQQQKEAERREKQRADNQRREAERRAQRDAETAVKLEAGLENTRIDAKKLMLSTVTASAVVLSEQPENADTPTDSNPRRRRGRRGGRRRRRPDGETPESSKDLNDQSEMEFDDGEDQDEIVIHLDQANSDTNGQSGDSNPCQFRILN